MLKTLKFVKGAVSTKDFVPAMKHFAITDGRVRAFNGMLALNSPIDLDLHCFPLAVPMIHAINNCADVVSMSMPDSGRLRVQSGKFRAFVPCVEEAVFSDPQPKGDLVGLDGEAFMKAVNTLRPFVGSDASRPWTNGIMLRGKSAFATNNVCLVEHWLGVDFPYTVNVPMKALDEIVRVGEPPDSVQLDENTITFHYPDGRWILTQLFSTEWPDIAAILNRPSAPVAIPEDLFTAMATIKPFIEKDGRLYIRDSTIHTTQSNEAGASHVVDGMGEEGVYIAKMLGLLEGVATMADFSQYPDPVMFFGDGVRGAILGQRL